MPGTNGEPDHHEIRRELLASHRLVLASATAYHDAQKRRVAAILAAKDAGWTQQRVAATMGITHQRVAAITNPKPKKKGGDAT